MSSLKASASLWQSDFHLNTVFEEQVVVSTFYGHPALPWPQSGRKCGLWWMSVQGGLFIRDYSTNTKISRTCAIHSLSSQRQVNFLTIDPLQDLVVIVSLPIIVTDAEQDYRAFWVECQSASSQRPHPDSVCASLECKHTFDVRDMYHVDLIGESAICGDRIFIYYYIENRHAEPAPATFMQVIDWRKGCTKSHLLLDHPQGFQHKFHVVNQRTIVAIRSSLITVHTLQEFDESLRPRLTYLLPKRRHLSVSSIHVSPSFCGTTARTDLMPGHVPSLESQIIVLEFISDSRTPAVILVIDTVIFSGTALQSETHVKILWSDWGPQHTRCFPHDPSYKISVIGSKMAYALPQGHTPEPGKNSPPRITSTSISGTSINE
ncbi:hypothetical protein EV702DRAFT_1119919 [Suillus placidus]|uniref:Uncharacterized protein n=1 Tax=Suillus placidus TaxID=48579 RepID=A0A9P6ZR50_9AGAM|nr:hypothetical protein EV702DRAFT_1119919 [Suillus placidus]